MRGTESIFAVALVPIGVIFVRRREPIVVPVLGHFRPWSRIGADGSLSSETFRTDRMPIWQSWALCHEHRLYPERRRATVRFIGSLLRSQSLNEGE